MPVFSLTSKRKLSTCSLNLQTVFDVVVKDFDCTILEGHRTMERQTLLHETGKSQLPFPRSKHNVAPSRAVDVAPYPIDWNDRERMTYFAGYVLGTADAAGIKLRWGGDWNRDWQLRDNVFDDLVHFEEIV